MIDRMKFKDYITTVALAAVPVILTYQAEIGKFVPMEYALIFTLAMGVLSQLATESRVKEAYKDTSAVVDEAQIKMQEYQDMVAKLQTEIDERQKIINTVVALKELDNAPVIEDVLTGQ